ncbi:MAG: Calx-beta domain-containing protein [Bdellovibrionales bacterium]
MLSAIALSGCKLETNIKDLTEPASDIPILSTQDVSITEGTTAAYLVTMNRSSSMPVVVVYQTLPQTATSGADYTALFGLLTIPAGQTFGYLPLAALEDPNYEGNEIFRVELSAASNAVMASATLAKNITILDNENRPKVFISDATVGEGGTLTFNVTTDVPSELEVAFNYASVAGLDPDPLMRASAGADFTSVAGRITLAALSMATSIPVISLQDILDENDELFHVTLTSLSNSDPGDVSGLGEITDDDLAPVLSVSDLSINEGDTGSLAVSLSVISGLPVVFDIATSNGSNVDPTLNAQAPGDYTAKSLVSVTIAAGQAQVIVTLVTIEDLVDEQDEGFFATVSNVTNAGTGQLISNVTIVDDDGPPLIYITDTAVVEGGTLAFVVSLTAPSALDVTFNFQSFDGTATTADSDYTGINSAGTIPMGSLTTLVYVITTADTKYEANETMTVSLSAVVNAGNGDLLATGTITNDDSPPGLYITDAAVLEGETAHFVISLSEISSQDVTVNWFTANGTATTSDSDYTGVASTLVTIPAGSLTVGAAVITVEDTRYEANETYNVSLQTATGATIVDNTGVGTITNDDVLPTIYIDDLTMSEGETGQFVVSLSTAAGLPVVFDWQTFAATATAPGDFTAVTTTTRTIPAGTLFVNVAVITTEDALNEVSENFQVSLSSLTNAAAGDLLATGTITDDDAAPSLYIVDAAAVSEGQTSVFWVTMTAASGLDVTFNYQSVDGTAVSTQDYTAVALTMGTIPAGSLSVAINVVTIDDLVDETSPENYTVTLTSPTNATISDGIGLGTINDNDNPPLLYVLDSSVNEGETLTFYATLSQISDLDVVFNYTSLDGTGGDRAQAPGDYTSVSNQTMTIPAGSLSVAMQVVTVEDVTFEADEKLNITLSSLSNVTLGDDGLGEGTILNDDAGPLIFIGDASVTEGQTAVFAVTISALSSVDVIFTWNTTNDTATGGSDYTAVGATVVTIPAGSLTTAVSVVTIDDVVAAEPAETFNVTLTGLTNVNSGDINGVGTINDNDTSTLYIGDASVTEGGTLIFAVTLSLATGVDVTFNFQTVDGTATTADSDYTSIALTAMTIPAGSLTSFLAVVTAADTKYENNETLNVTLTSAVNAGAGDMNGVGTINNDDSVPGVYINDVTVIEGGTANFSISLSAVSGVDVTVNWATVDGTATTANSDYTGVGTTLVTIPAGSLSVVGPVITLQDTLHENSETYTITLTSAAGGTIVDGLGLGTITDDDTAPQLSIYDLTILEGETGQFVVSLSALSGLETVFSWQTFFGTATAPDFTAVSTTVITIPALTSSVQLPLITSEDLLNEGDETFLASLSAASNATFLDDLATGTITDDDGPPMLYVLDAASVTEGQTSLFWVTLTAASGLDVTFSYRTFNDTAVSTQDYTAVGLTSATIPAGSLSVSFNVVTIDDTQDEVSPEYFDLSISAPNNATIADALGKGGIADNDNPPEIFIADVAVSEGGTRGFWVTLSAVSDLNVDFSYVTNDGLGTDKAEAPGDYTAITLTAGQIPAGSLSLLINVVTIQDVVAEPSELLTMTLSALSNAAHGDDGIATGTINDNDVVPFTWVGTTGDGLWSTAGNWSGLTVPTAANVATFTNVCLGANCNATVDVAVDVQGLNMTSAYSGTITQAAGVALRTGNSDWLMAGGAFIGSSGAITINRDFNQSGGTFTAGTQTIEVQRNWTSTAGAMNMTGSTVEFKGASGTTINIGAQQFYNLSLLKDAWTAAAATGSVTIANDFSLNQGFNAFNQGRVTGGTFDVVNRVNLGLNNGGYGPWALRLVGTGAQTIAGGIDSESALNQLHIAKPSGLVSVEGTIGIDSDFTYMSGSTFNAGTSAIHFINGYGTLSLASDLDFYDVKIAKYQYANVTIVGAGTMQVNHDLTLDASNVLLGGALLGGSIRAMGNVYANSTGGYLGGSTTVLYLAGTGAQTIVGGDGDLPSVVINSTGTVDLTGTFAVVGSFIHTNSAGLSAGTSTVYLESTGTSTVSMGAQSLNNVNVSSGSGRSMVIAGALTINGNAELSGSAGGNTLDGGTLVAKKNVSITSADFDGGTASILLNGTGAQTISNPGGGAWTSGKNYVDKVSGAVELAGNTTFALAQDMDFTSGTINMRGYDLGIRDALTMASGTTIYTDCGVLTYNGGSSSLGGTIIDGTPGALLSVNDVTVSESAGNATFTVTLAAPSCAPTIFNFATVNGTAVQPGDYTSTSGVGTIPAGQQSWTTNVPIIDDTLYEGATDETFTFSLSAVMGAPVLDPLGVGSITDNDAQPNIFVNDVTVTEGQTANFVISLSNATTSDVTFTWETVNGTATSGADYTGVGATSATIAAGQLAITVAVVTTDDVVFSEGDENYNVTLTSIANASAGDTNGVGTINDNDNAFLFIADADVVESGTLLFVVTMSAVSGSEVTFSFQSYSGLNSVIGGAAATSGTDFTAISGTATISAGVLAVTLPVVTTVDATYEGLENLSVTISAPVGASITDSTGLGFIHNDDCPATGWCQQAYIKAINADAGDIFGEGVSIMDDTLVVGAPYELSSQTTITNDTTASSDNSASQSGAAYVYVRSGNTWVQQAYIKRGKHDGYFGRSVSINGDTLAIGAFLDVSGSTQIFNGTGMAYDSPGGAEYGAVHIYKRTGSTWVQEAFIKASNSRANTDFGNGLNLAKDSLVVASASESSNQSYITQGTGSSTDASSAAAGAVYIYRRTGNTWVQEAYVKASNRNNNDRFGFGTAFDGQTLAVGAIYEDSNGTGVYNGTGASADNSSADSGAVYVYARSGTWVQQAYIKSALTGGSAYFGYDVALSGDTLVVGEPLGRASAVLINGTQAPVDENVYGTATVYKRTGSTWVQQAILKPPVQNYAQIFGAAVAISQDRVAVAAYAETSLESQVFNGTAVPNPNAGTDETGAVFVYARTGSTWVQQATLKPSNPDNVSSFGAPAYDTATFSPHRSLAISGDTIVVGSNAERSNQRGITNGPWASLNRSAISSGAAYVFHYKGAPQVTIQQAATQVDPASSLPIEFSVDFGKAISTATFTDADITQNGTATGITWSITNPSGDNRNFVLQATGGTAGTYTPSVAAGLVTDVDGNTNLASSTEYDNSVTYNIPRNLFITDAEVVEGGTMVFTVSLDGTAGSDVTFNYQSYSGLSTQLGGAAAAQGTDFTATSGAATIPMGSLTLALLVVTTVDATYEGMENLSLTLSSASGATISDSTGLGFIHNDDCPTTGWCQQAYLKGATADANDLFGYWTAIHRDTVVVGAPYESADTSSVLNGTGGSSSNGRSRTGAAYVYKRTGGTWVQEAYLKGATTDVDDFFGDTVAIHEDTIVVSSYGEGSSSSTIVNGTGGSSNNSHSNGGAAYVFKRTGNTWVREAYLKAGTPKDSSYFGEAVSIHGDTILVTALSDSSGVSGVLNGTGGSTDTSVSSAGSAYIFKRTGNTWVREAYLKAANPDASDYFGSSAALDRDTAVITAAWESSGTSTVLNGTGGSADNSVNQVGAAYVFKRTGNTWVQEAYLKPYTAIVAYMFGQYDTAISGDTIAIGANGDSSNATGITHGTGGPADTSGSSYSGAVYIFKRTGSTWARQAFIKATNAGSWDQLGSWVSLSGDLLAAGADSEDSYQSLVSSGTLASSTNDGTDIGAAYIFRRTGNTWVQDAYIKPSNGDTGDLFASVRIDGDTLVVGARGESSNLTGVINGPYASINNSAVSSGAAYVFHYKGAPQVTIQQAATQVDPASSLPIEFSVDFGKAISTATFTDADITQNGTATGITWSITNPSGDNRNFVLQATGGTAGTYTPSVAAGLVTDVDGNTNLASSTEYDNSVTYNIPRNLFITDAEVVEGGTMVFTVSLDGTAGSDVTFNYQSYSGLSTQLGGAAAAQGTDFTATSGAATIPMGSLTLALLVVTTVDATYEGMENLSLTLSSASGATISDSTGLGFIHNDDCPTTGWCQQAYMKVQWGKRLGESTSVHNDTVVVGATTHSGTDSGVINGTGMPGDSAPLNSGMAVVYARSGSTWVRQATLLPPAPDTFDYFGRKVRVSGNTAVMSTGDEDSLATGVINGTGAAFNEGASASGAALVYKRTGNTWVQEAYLKASNAEADDGFGFAIDLDEDTVVVGAYKEDSSVTGITAGTGGSSDNTAADAGAVYVFKRTGNTWVQEAFLKANNTGADDQFGYSVAVSQNTVVVTAPNEDSSLTGVSNGPGFTDNELGANDGSAYVFRRTGSTWVQEAILRSSGAGGQLFFGNDIDISADSIIVANYLDYSDETGVKNGTDGPINSDASASGAAYIFKRTGLTWVQESYLKAGNSEANDEFARGGVAISGNLAAVGSIREDSISSQVINGTASATDNDGVNSGAVYVYRRTGNTWVQSAYLKASNGKAGDLFGSSVAIDGDTLIVGAEEESSTATQVANQAWAPAFAQGSSIGAAYVFYYKGAPEVVIQQASTQADPTSSLPIAFNVAFSKPISAGTFTDADITQGGTATGITWSITNPSGDNRNFVLQATAGTAGTYIPSVAAGLVTDVDGNTNLASSSSFDNSVTYAPPSYLYISDASVLEGGTLVFNVSLDVTSTSEVTFNYQTVNGTATTADSDYTSVALTAFTIPAGTLTTSLFVVSTPDTRYENDETLSVTLTSIVTAIPGDTDGLGTIQNDDAVVGISVYDVAINEGETAQFVASLSAVSGLNAVFQWQTINGTATSASDYTAVSLTTVTIVAGQLTILLPVISTENATAEPTEQFTVSLSSATNGNFVDPVAIGTILDDDVAAFTWVGTTGDQKWTTAANWSTGTVPGSADIAIFNNVCATLCAANIDGNITVSGILLESTYTATLSQNTGQPITVGFDDLIIAGGAFQASNADIRLNDAVWQQGGTVNMGSANWYFDNCRIDAGTWNAQTSTAHMNGSGFSGSLIGAATFNNLSLVRDTSLGNPTEAQVNGTITVAGTLLLDKVGSNAHQLTAVGSSKIVALGNVNAVDFDGGDTGLIEIGGTGVQTLTGGIGGQLPNVAVIKTGGSLDLVGTIDFAESLGMASGTVNAGTSTVRFVNTGSITVVQGGVDFYNMEFRKDTSAGNLTVTLGAGSHLFADGDVLFESTGSNRMNVVHPSSSSIVVQGDITATKVYDTPSLRTNKPSGTQTITGVAGAQLGAIHLGSASTVNLVGTIDILEGFENLSTATVNPGTSLVRFINAPDVAANSSAINLGAGNYLNQVVFNKSSVWNTINGVVTITGNLTIDNSNTGNGINSAPVQVQGNVVMLDNDEGTGRIEMTGAAHTTVTMVASSAWPTGGWTVNKPGASVRLLSNITLSPAGTDLTLTAGTISLSGYHLSVRDVLTMASGTVIDKGCGTVRVNGTLLPDGPYSSGTITNTSPSINLSVNDVTVGEADGNATFTVTLSGAHCAAVTFNYATVNGTAAQPGDYTSTSGVGTIAAGQLTLAVNVPIINDSDYEGSTDETFTLSLSGVSGVAVLDPYGVGSITDNDAAPVLFISDATATEGGTLDFIVTLASSSGSEITFNFQTYNGTATTAQDYTAQSGSATIAIGATSVTISVVTLDDTTDEESPESLTLTISSATNAAIVDTTGVGSINDNDNAPLIFVNTASVNEGGTLQFGVSLSQSSDREITFQYSTNDGAGSDKAEAPGDYTAVTNQVVTIAAGSLTTSLGVVTAQETTFEMNEKMKVVLSSLVNVTSGDTGEAEGTISNEDTFTPVVVAVYPTNGANWNDYVKYDNDNGGTNTFNQDDIACTGAETGRYGQLNGCIHGGERRKVTVTGYTSCTNLTMTDSVGAFDWKCIVSGGTATFYSTSFNSGKGLADLINATSWKNITVTVLDGVTTLGTSAAAAWASNIVAALPDNNSTGAVVQLDGTDDDTSGPDFGITAGSILTRSTDMTASRGFNLNADRLSIVTLGTARITYDPSAGAVCDWTTGETTGATTSVFLCTGGQKFIWIEGNFAGDTSSTNDLLMTLVNTKHSRVHKTRLTRSEYETFYLYNSNSNMVTDLAIHTGSAYYNTFGVDASSYNTFVGVKVSNSIAANPYVAIYVTGASSYNVFHEIALSNAPHYGFFLENGTNNTISKVVLANTTGRAYYISGAQGSVARNTTSHLTMANAEGIILEGYTFGADYQTLNQAVVANGSDYAALYVYGANNAKISQFVSGHNSVDLTASGSNGFFTNNMLIGPSASGACNGNTGTNTGLGAFTCTNQGSSDANFVIGSSIDLTNSFVGKATSDSANTSDTSGTAAYNTITDFLNFENFYRLWGLDGSGAFPHASQEGRCSGTSTCRIWDWRLKSTDTVLRNKSNDGSTSNDAFTANSTCPAAVHGNKALADQQTSVNTFLINAQEIMLDGVGDDDGLCESSEECIYSPNFGAYQGEGNYKAGGTCTFQNGTITGVIMYAYPTNGG